MAEIRWVSFGMDRKSIDGRWHIRHPENTPSGRWELYDIKASVWHGDWRTCTQAKKRAASVAATDSIETDGRRR